jgi:DNA-binding HxlR family transcriptional regulator
MARRPEALPSQGCPVGDLLAFLGKPYVLDILRLFHEEPRPHRFLEIQQRLGLSPNTLTGRLKELVRSGFLVRTAYPEIPPRVDYSPTPKARALDAIFDALGDWAREHDLAQFHPAHAVAALARA